MTDPHLSHTLDAQVCPEPLALLQPHPKRSGLKVKKSHPRPQLSPSQCARYLRQRDRCWGWGLSEGSVPRGICALANPTAIQTQHLLGSACLGQAHSDHPTALAACRGEVRGFVGIGCPLVSWGYREGPLGSLCCSRGASVPSLLQASSTSCEVPRLATLTASGTLQQAHLSDRTLGQTKCLWRQLASPGDCA